jgi:hypothetical protein
MADPIVDNSMARVRSGAISLGLAAALVSSAAASAAGRAALAFFPSPEAAAEALATAAATDKPAALLHVLGPAAGKLVRSGDPVADHEGRAKFVAGYQAGHKIVQEGENRAVLEIGSEQWPFPIPIIHEANGWRFDTAAGEQEILGRRIGRNELNAIEVCRAYVDAQRDYAAARGKAGGILEYAQKFVSAPGQHDGLYWPTDAGEEPSPLGMLVAQARAEGYDAGRHHQQPTPFHGYSYRILTQQGKDAPGGAYDYMANGHMIGGFALVAFPATYGDSGVMTFIVNQDGAVFEKNLGPDTASIARQMREFDPDPGWRKVGATE